MPGVRGPLLRRVRLGALFAALAVSVAASAGALVLIAERLAPRVDLSAGQHTLSPRTRRLLESLSGDYRLVVAVDGQRTDRRALDRVADVLETFDRASPHVSRDLIDTATPAGAERFRALVAELVARDRPAIERHAETVREAARTLENAAAGLRELAPLLDTAARAIPDSAPNATNNRAYLAQRARTANVRAGELEDLAAGTRGALEPATPEAVVDPHALASRLAQPFAALDRELTGLADDLEKFSGDRDQGADARRAADPAARLARSLRRDVAIAGDRLARVRPTDASRVANALSRSEGVLVIGPQRLDADGLPVPGAVSAVDAESLLLSTEVLERAGIAAAPEIGRRAEDLLAAGIAAIADPDQPIVVLVHGGTASGADRQRFDALFEQLRRRLATRGVDLIDWAAGEPGAQRPRPVELDPTGRREVVYAVFPPDAATASATGDPERSGPRRAQRLGAALAQLVGEGRPILLSLNPSPDAGVGLADPIAAVLPRYGLAAATDRPLFRSAVSGGSRLSAPLAMATGAEPASGAAEHPLAAAVAGLPTLLPWPITLTPAADGAAVGVEVTPLLTVADDESTWAESQWIGVWSSRTDERRLSDQTTPDPRSDTLRPPGGGDRWLVAAAAERRDPALPEPARLVVVGGNAWFTDPVAMRQANLDGRQFFVNPGNLELFESGVMWLAGRDDLIARSSASQAVPLVRIRAEELSAVRWVLLGGLPLGVLVLGGIYRVLTG